LHWSKPSAKVRSFICETAGSVLFDVHRIYCTGKLQIPAKSVARPRPRVPLTTMTKPAEKKAPSIALRPFSAGGRLNGTFASRVETTKHLTDGLAKRVVRRPMSQASRATVGLPGATREASNGGHARSKAQRVPIKRHTPVSTPAVATSGSASDSVQTVAPAAPDASESSDMPIPVATKLVGPEQPAQSEVAQKAA
jgi:hypothetical protein